MSDYLQLKTNDCKNCYKCIRHCPVKSIRFSDQKARIVPEECILCGQCYVVCPQHAKEIRNDNEKVKRYIADGYQVVASLAPSFIAAYEGIGIEGMAVALRRLGFAAVEETAIGAHIIKQHYEKMVAEGRPEVLISSCCHSVNLMIQKHYPQAISYLAHVLSPMQMHCTDVKKRMPEAKTVFIGPCIAKKEEGERYPGIVDVVLTFEELDAWFAEENVRPEPITDRNEQSKARLFPIAGGILDTMRTDDPDCTYMAVDGADNVKRALADILEKNPGKCFIEMSMCKGSCVCGPAMGEHRDQPVKDNVRVRQYAGPKDFETADYERSEITKTIYTRRKPFPSFNDSEIEEVLHQIGKYTPEDELNCGTCGYNTCREKAVAVLLGKANLNMCLPFLKEKTESFSEMIVSNTPNAFIVLDEQYRIQQMNRSARRLLQTANWDYTGETVNKLMDPDPFLKAFENENGTYDHITYLSEYDKHVEQTVFFDKQYRVFICIMRDITREYRQAEEARERREQTIEITNKVIEKQMMAVQEIASLLGETTAETKVALTKLKESMGQN